MKLLLIGHACWLIETADVKILFDPLLFDPNQGNCCEVHPSRTVDPSGLGNIDVVVISHRHIDHFDIGSLCSLPKAIRILCPNDSLITDTLAKIRFANIQRMTEWVSARFGATTIQATPSSNPVPELGFVVADGTNTIWNQVDTQVTGDTGAKVNQLYGRLNALIAPWQPLLDFKFQFNKSTAFPHERYAALLEQTKTCDTEILIPGASGYRYTRRSKWLNRIEFPVARDRFLEDLKGALSAGDTTFFKINPGDEIVCDRSGHHVRRQASYFVSSAECEEHLVEFCPVDPFENLFKDKPAVSVADCGMAAAMADLDSFIQREIHTALSPMVVYKNWKVLYQLIVCVDQGNLFVHWDFGRDADRVDNRSTRATATSIISGQTLRGLAAGTCGWEEAYNSGEWRFFQSVALVSTKDYLRPKIDEITDVLQLRYPYAQALQDHISAELNRWMT